VKSVFVIESLQLTTYGNERSKKLVVVVFSLSCKCRVGFWKYESSGWFFATKTKANLQDYNFLNGRCLEFEMKLKKNLFKAPGI
jgi:hypothetical protein